MRFLALFVMLFALSACGGHDVAPLIPTVVAPGPVALTDVWVEGSVPGLDEALNELGASIPVRFHRGRGPRQISIETNTALVREQSPDFAAMSSWNACPCTGEGRAVFVEGAAYRALVLHELGHLFGLQHVDTPNALMNPRVHPGAHLDPDSIERMRRAVLLDSDEAAH